MILTTPSVWGRFSDLACWRLKGSVRQSGQLGGENDDDDCDRNSADNCSHLSSDSLFHEEGLDSGSIPLIQFVLFLGTPMHSAAVNFRFRRLTGIKVLLAFLFALSRLGGTQNTTYSHGTSTCLAENDTHGFKLVLTEIDRCGAN